jgi:2Fe-2S iron-sulfur cluster binding domain
MTTIHLRRAGSIKDDWETILLPSPTEAGISASNWGEVSASAALAWIQRENDPSLAFLLSCRRGLCDVCAVRIDGKVVTACTTPVRDGMRIEPTKDKLALAGTIIDISLVRRARV